ncbi:MAG: hypothetical protein GY751_11760, partial [Bacteroidetes bacterium]|nr:hypothetical protein [Bacteroidota bacterium]
MRQFVKFLFLAGIATGIFFHPQLNAQSNLNGNGNTFEISADGSYTDYIIPTTISPEGTSIPSNLGLLEFYLVGGDGGRRKVNTLFGNCQKKGGGGAKVSVSFRVGTLHGELEPGGTIRFVPGKKGNSHTGGGVNGAGGGGGSGILYKPPVVSGNGSCTGNIDGENKPVPSQDFADDGTCWILLAVAGGGGGAYSDGACGGSHGKNGNSGENGSRGHYTSEIGDPGGSNGNGGGHGFENTGGGGGYRGHGRGAQRDVRGKAGAMNGGNGGNGEHHGGFGYSGGGNGGENGGGGGGFSGGAGGGRYGGGGGAGSFVNEFGINETKTSGDHDGTPDDGYISYNFSVDESGGYPVAKCRRVVVNMNGQVTQGVNPGMADNGSYDPDGLPITKQICGLGGNGFCGSGRVITCSDVGKNITQILKVSNGAHTATCNFSIEVEAGTPELTCPSDITVALDPNTCIKELTSGLSPLSYAGCDIGLSYEINHSAGNSPGPITGTGEIASHSFNDGNTIVTYHLSEEFGDPNSCSFTVSVTDPLSFCSEPPVAICQDVTVSANANCEANATAIDFNGGSYDPEGYPLSFSVSPSAPYYAGITDITLTVTSGSGGSDFCLTTISVEDDTPPEITCPANITDEVSPGSCSVHLTSGLAPLSTVGGCSIGLSYEVRRNSGDITYVSVGSGEIDNRYFTSGNSNIHYYLTNNAGTTSSCSFSVSVADNEVPVARCKDITIEVGTLVWNFANLVDDGSSDNCEIQSMSLDKNSFGCNDIGDNAVTMTVRDMAGNESTCMANITVDDINNDGDPSTACGSDCDDTNPNIYPGATEICDGVDNDCDGSVDEGFDGDGDGYTTCGGDCNDGDDSTNPGATEICDGVDNDCDGQIDEGSVCNQPPVAVCQDITVSADANCQGSVAAIDFDGGSSDPDGDPMTFTVSPAGPYPLGTTAVTLTVADQSAESSSCTATVTVEDNTPPVLICRDLTVQLDQNGDAEILPVDFLVE